MTQLLPFLHATMFPWEQTTMQGKSFVLLENNVTLLGQMKPYHSEMQQECKSETVSKLIDKKKNEKVITQQIIIISLLPITCSYWQRFKTTAGENLLKSSDPL